MIPRSVGEQPYDGALLPRRSSRDTTFECRGLRKVRRALNGTFVLSVGDLRLGRGDVLGLIGPNGSGKSTFLALAVGLLRPSAGGIRWCGKPLSAARSELGFVPPKGLEPSHDWQVENWLVFQGRLWGWERSAAIKRASTACAEAELSQQRHVRLSELSEGQRRRLMIAHAFLNNPKYLVLDEPELSLDADSQRRLFDEVTKASTGGATVLVASHALESLAIVATAVVFLEGGRITAWYQPARETERVEWFVVPRSQTTAAHAGDELIPLASGEHSSVLGIPWHLEAGRREQILRDLGRDVARLPSPLTLEDAHRRWREGGL